MAPPAPATLNWLAAWPVAHFASWRLALGYLVDALMKGKTIANCFIGFL